MQKWNLLWNLHINFKNHDVKTKQALLNDCFISFLEIIGTGLFSLQIPMYASWAGYPPRQTTAALPQPVLPASLGESIVIVPILWRHVFKRPSTDKHNGRYLP